MPIAPVPGGRAGSSTPQKWSPIGQPPGMGTPVITPDTLPYVPTGIPGVRPSGMRAPPDQTDTFVREAARAQFRKAQGAGRRNSFIAGSRGLEGPASSILG